MSTNSSSVAPTDLFYQKYHGTGFSFTLIWFHTPLLTISAIGVVLNGSLLFMLWKCRSSLTGSFHYLLAMETLGSLIMDAHNPFVIVPILFSGLNYVRAENCFFFMILKNFGNSLQQTMMVFISVERLLCVQCPIWHRNFSNKWKRIICLKIMTGISVIYGTMRCTFIYIDTHGDLAGRDVTCINGDFAASWWTPIVNNISLSVQIVTTAMYAWIWAIMAKGAITKVKVTNSYNMHLLKALSVIMAIIMFGWMQYAIVQNLLRILKPNPEDKLAILEMIGTLAVFASSTNGPVLYIFSTEYRRNFQKVFPRIFGAGQTKENTSTRPAVQQQAWQ